MPTKISALTAVSTPLDTTETLPVVQSGTTKKATVANLATPITGMYNVKHYGAGGLGITNEVSAINAAITAASAAGGGVVFFPSGTYGVTPNGSYVITAKPNVTLWLGPGATLKILNNSNTWAALISHESADDVSGFSILGPGSIDCNAAGQNTPSLSSNYHVPVWVRRGRGFWFDKVTFKNIDNINTIVVNGHTGSSEPVASAAHITNCDFRDVQGSGHDHSTIYTAAYDVVIANNSFHAKETAGAPAGGAICAIETHGGRHVVEGNTITGFREAINGTGSAHTSDTQIVNNNAIYKCARGIRLFANATVGGSQPSMRTFNVSGNAIYIVPDYWAAVDDEPTGGIHFVTVAGEQFYELTIANNTISHATYTGSDTDIASSSAGGIMVTRSGALNTTSYNLSITGNTVRGALGAGIWVLDLIEGLTIANNTIQNPGHSAVTTADYRAGIFVGGGIKYGTIHGNNIRDDRSSGNRTARGVNWICTEATTAHNQIVDNIVVLTDGSGVELNVSGANTGGPYVRHVVRSGSTSTPTSACRFGSIWTTTTATVTQTTATAGTTWA